MVKIERTSTPPPSLAIEREKKSGSYRELDVILQLRQDFHDKCYLCEIDELQSAEVEHLHSHGGSVDLMFSWPNLFLSCRHCNSIKNQGQYHDIILDCCNVDPETVMQQELRDGHVSVTPTSDSQEAIMTARLLTECFEKKNTGIRTLESTTRVTALSRTMNTLYKTLSKHRMTPSMRSLKTLRGMLNRTYRFSGFTRTYVRMHLKEYPDLAEYVKL